MKRYWYDHIHEMVEKAVLVKLPFEIINFPSTGITSAINRYAERTNNIQESHVKCIVIDLRAANFTQDKNHNKIEFLRILVSHFEQYLDFKLKYTDEDSIFKILQTTFQSYFEQKKTILIVFYQSSKLNFIDIPELKDFLLFLDRLRDNTNGLVNFILTSNTPEFDTAHPAPFPIISKYYGYFDQGRIYRTLNEETLLDGGFKRHTAEDVLKLIEISGGLGGVLKSLLRDLLFQDYKLNSIYKFEYDKNFFEAFENTKVVLDRIIQKLKPDYINALLRISNGQVAEVDSKSLEFLKKTNIVDENNQIRGEIFPNYLKIYLADFELIDSQENNKASDIKAVEVYENTSNYRNINPKLKIDILSGEIHINNLPHNEYLTGQELDVFKLLFENSNNEVTREQLAKVLWKEKAHEQYSDWAIDKLVSRLRDKLGDHKPHRIIQTVRNKGFVLRTNS